MAFESVESHSASAPPGGRGGGIGWKKDRMEGRKRGERVWVVARMMWCWGGGTRCADA